MVFFCRRVVLSGGAGRVVLSGGAGGRFAGGRGRARDALPADQAVTVCLPMRCLLMTRRLFGLMFNAAVREVVVRSRRLGLGQVGCRGLGGCPARRRVMTTR